MARETSPSTPHRVPIATFTTPPHSYHLPLPNRFLSRFSSRFLSTNSSPSLSFYVYIYIYLHSQALVVVPVFVRPNQIEHPPTKLSAKFSHAISPFLSIILARKGTTRDSISGIRISMQPLRAREYVECVGYGRYSPSSCVGV